MCVEPGPGMSPADRRTAVLGAGAAAAWFGRVCRGLPMRSLEFLYGVEMATQLVVKRKISSRLIKNKFFNRTEAAMLSRDGPGDLESLQWAAQTGKETCAVTNRS